MSVHIDVTLDEIADLLNDLSERRRPKLKVKASDGTHLVIVLPNEVDGDDLDTLNELENTVDRLQELAEDAAESEGEDGEEEDEDEDEAEEPEDLDLEEDEDEDEDDLDEDDDDEDEEEEEEEEKE